MWWIRKCSINSAKSVCWWDVIDLDTGASGNDSGKGGWLFCIINDAEG